MSLAEQYPLLTPVIVTTVDGPIRGHVVGYHEGRVGALVVRFDESRCSFRRNQAIYVLPEEVEITEPVEWPRQGTGTTDERALATRVACAIARSYDRSVIDFVVAGHEHEGLLPGSFSVAWTSDGWARLWPHTDDARIVAHDLGVRFEPVTDCILAVHPRQDSHG